jgi:hypothetical protein
MKVIRHLYNVAIGKLTSLTCKHKEFYSAACPFTGYTYTICSDCRTRLKALKTTDGDRNV